MGFNYTPEIMEQMRRMWMEEGATSRMIGDVLGLNRNQVIGRLARMRKLEGEKKWRQDDRRKHNLKAKGRKAAAKGRSTTPTPPKPLPVVPVPLNVKPVSFIDRSHDRCAFPLDDHVGPSMQCCGARTELGMSWCSFHRNLVFGQSKGGHFRLQNRMSGAR